MGPLSLGLKLYTGTEATVRCLMLFFSFARTKSAFQRRTCVVFGFRLRSKGWFSTDDTVLLFLTLGKRATLTDVTVVLSVQCKKGSGADSGRDIKRADVRRLHFQQTCLKLASFFLLRKNVGNMST